MPINIVKYEAQAKIIEMNIVPITKIKKLTYAKIFSLRNKCLFEIKDEEFEYLDINDLKKFPRLKTVFQEFNRQLIIKCKNKSFLKKEAKKHQNVFTWRLKNGDIVPLKLDLKTTQQGMLYVLNKYKTLTLGPWSTVKLNTKGNPKSIHIAETQDRDYFFDFITPKILKEREGMAPHLSAKVLAVGTKIKGQDGLKYIVKKTSNGQRWVKVKA